MVWLSLLDIAWVCVDQNQGLQKLYKVNAADKIILTVSKSAPEVKDTEASKEKLKDQQPNRYLEKSDASIYVEVLDVLKLLHEISLFLHKTGLFFWPMLLHLIAHFL